MFSYNKKADRISLFQILSAYLFKYIIFSTDNISHIPILSAIFKNFANNNSYFPQINEIIINHNTGTNNDGSIFKVLQFLIPKIESPELAIRNPPTTEISAIISAVIKFPSSNARQ